MNNVGSPRPPAQHSREEDLQQNLFSEGREFMTKVGDDGGGGGLRFNGGKLRYDLVPVYWRKLLAQVCTAGAAKYADWNWAKGMKYSTPLASMHRHIAAWEEGERFDKESGLPHLAHAAWNALAIAYYEEHHVGVDDRHAPRPKSLGCIIPGVPT